jgi:hypothetical protein
MDPHTARACGECVHNLVENKKRNHDESNLNPELEVEATEGTSIKKSLRTAFPNAYLASSRFLTSNKPVMLQ